MRRAPVVVVAVLVAMAGGIGWLLHRGDAPVGGDDLVIEEGIVGDAGAESLATRKAAGTTAADTAASSHGTVLCEVRRDGKPAAARVMAYEIDRGEPGRPVSWSREAEDRRVPLDEAARDAPVATGAATEDGKLTLDLPAPGSYEVVAIAADDAHGSSRATLSCEGSRVAAILDLRGGGESLDGRAVHADGQPFQGFVASPAPQEGGYGISTIRGVATSADGRFHIGGLDAGPATVCAYVPGRWCAVAHTIRIPHRGDYVLTVDGGTREIAGRVANDKDGQPVPGAVVEATGWNVGGNGMFSGRGVADGEGKVTLRVPDGRVWWTVSALGYATLRMYRRAAPAGEVMDFRLVKTGRITGRVTTEGEGRPVPDIDVYAETLGATGDRRGVHAKTDGEGRFELKDVRPGEVTVLAYGNGWYTKGFESTQPDGFNPLGVTLAPESSASIDLVVSKAARATGRVVDAKGQPVAGAEVTATRLAPGRQQSGTFTWLPSAQACATGADGRFIADTLVPGTSYKFEAVAAGASPASAGPLRAELEKPLEVEIKLGQPRYAELTCTEKGAGPLGGVTVYAYSQDPTRGWLNHGTAQTSSAGLARLGPLPPGEMYLYAWSEGYQSNDQKKTGGPEGSMDDIHDSFVLYRTHRISGVVRHADGSAPIDAVIHVSGTGFESTGDLGEDGTFDFQGMEEGTFLLEVKKGWEGEVLASTRSKTDDAQVILTVPGNRPPRFVVRVLDPDGRPVPVSNVCVQSDENEDCELVSEGRREMVVPSKESWLLAHGAASSTGSELPYAFAIAGPVAPDTKEFEIRLTPESRIEGTVRAADGRGVRGVRVYAAPLDLPAPFGTWSGEVSSARSNDAGRFRVGRLRPGSYRLRVATSDEFGPTEPVTANAGDLEVAIVLGAGLEVSPTIVDADGAPVAGATVYANPRPNGSGSVADTDANGVARLRGLNPKAEAYQLIVNAPQDRADCVDLTLDPWRPASETVRLGRGLVIEGIVRDVAGRPVAGASVDRLAGRGAAQRSATKSNGTFVMNKVPTGDVVLVARSDNPAGASRPIRVAAGARDVVLTLDATVSVDIEVEAWKPVEGGLWVNFIDEETKVGTDWTQIDDAGRGKVTGLHPSTTYMLYLLREPEGVEPEIAWKAGIKGSDGSVKVKLGPAMSVTGHVTVPPGAKDVVIEATDGLASRQAMPDEAGRFRVTGLHPGRWTLTANGTAGSSRIAAKADVDAGGSVELDLKPVP